MPNWKEIADQYEREGQLADAEQRAALAEVELVRLRALAVDAADPEVKLAALAKARYAKDDSWNASFERSYAKVLVTEEGRALYREYMEARG